MIKMANMFVTGMTGSGKSYYIRHVIKSLKDLPLTVVSLKKQDIVNVDKESRKLDNKYEVTTENYSVIKALDNVIGKKNLGFYMGYIDNYEQIEFMDTLAQILRHKTNTILYIDEAHNFIPQSGKHSKELIKLISVARENNLHIILATQRPQDIQKSPLNNCKWKISFKLSETNAVRAMTNIFEDIDESDIKNLNEYYFIIQEATTHETAVTKI
jgi:nucleoside-triphosphatase THEP1